MRKSTYLYLAVLIGLIITDGTLAQQEKGKRQRGSRQAQVTPVALNGGVATLSPENSKVIFVGTHTGDEPKPRFGGFKSFSGQLTTNADGKEITSLVMEFETASLFTQLGGDLTNHLKSADFLDVENYPTAKFVSTEVSAGENGTFNIVGGFTLMGQTNSITIPVTLNSTAEGVVAQGELKLDRTRFGMDQKTERVSKEVSIMLSVGHPTADFAPASMGEGSRKSKGGKGRGNKGKGGRRMDPSAMFEAMDADGDGKLVGEEIPERMRQWSDSMDTDGDKAITLEELSTAMNRFRGGGGRGKGGGGAAPRKSRPAADE